MDFVIFLGVGIVAGLIVRYLIMALTFPVGLLAMGALVGLSPHSEDKEPGTWYWPTIALLTIYNAYVMTAWAALCAAYIHVFMDARGPSWPFIYWVAGICIATAPIVDMTSRDIEFNLQNDIAVIITPLSFIVFALFPVLMGYVHGWWLLWVLTVLP